MIRRTALGAAALLALVAFVAPGAPVAAAVKVPGSIRLASQTPWVLDGGRFDLHLAVQGTRAADELEIDVTVHQRVSSRSEFARTVDGRIDRGVLAEIDRPLDQLALDQHGNRFLSLSLPPATATDGPTTLPPLTAGVYPVRVELRTASGHLVDRLVTHLVRPPSTATGSLEVAWVQPVTGSPALQPSGRVALRETAHDGIVSLLASLTANRQVPMTLDVSPDTVAALGPADRTSLRALVDARHPILAAPFVDVDPSALILAGRGADLALQRQVGEGELFAALGDQGDPRTWSAHRYLSAAALERLQALGVTRLIVPESSLQPLASRITGRRTLSRPFQIAATGAEPLQGVIADADLASHFRADGEGVLRAHQLLADLAVLYFDAPGATRGVVIRPPTGWRPSRAFLDTALPALATASVVRPVPLDQLLQDVAPLSDDGRTVVRKPSTSARVARLPAKELDAAHRALDEAVAIVGAGSDQATAIRRRLLAGEAAELSRADRKAMLGSITGAVDEIRGHLRIPARRTIRLTARRATIPITVVNGNAFPVHADLVLSSEKLDFTRVHGRDRGRQVLHLVLAPGTHTSAIPVRARVSATFSLRAALLTPDGRVLVRSRFTMVSTVFSGVGIFLSIGAGLFLLLWWASHWRTVRRDRRLVEPPHESGH